MSPQETEEPLYRFDGDVDPDFLAAAMKAGLVAWDIETTGLDWRLDDIGTVQVYAPHYGVALVRLHGSVPERLRDLLEADRVQKVFHHAPFDLRFMRHRWKATPRRVACTKIASRIVHPEWDHELHSLAPLVQRFFDVHLDKSVRMSDWTASNLSEEQERYAVADVLYLPALLETLMSQAIAGGVADQVEASFRYVPVRIETDLRECGDVFSY